MKKACKGQQPDETHTASGPKEVKEKGLSKWYSKWRFHIEPLVKDSDKKMYFLDLVLSKLNFAPQWIKGHIKITKETLADPSKATFEVFPGRIYSSKKLYSLHNRKKIEEIRFAHLENKETLLFTIVFRNEEFIEEEKAD